MNTPYPPTEFLMPY